MRTPNTLLGATLAAGSWLAGYALMTFLCSGYSCAASAPLLVGWWATLYLSSKINISLRSAQALATIYFVLAFLAASADRNIFLHEIEPFPIWRKVLGCFVQGACLASPVVLEACVRRAGAWLSVRRRSA